MATTTAATRGLFFFKRFLRNPREVGALCPSSRHLAAEMVRGLELRPKDTVVEYGVGTGSFTPTIAAHMEGTPDTRYLGIERESGFVDIIRQRFPKLTFANAQVEDVAELLADNDMKPPRAILSGLPLVLLPTMEEIVRKTHEVLAPGGEFRTFTYIQSYVTPASGRVRRLMKELFAEFSVSRLILRNFPPAFVLKGVKAS